MTEKKSRESEGDVAGGLAGHLGAFFGRLAALGYREATQQEKRRTLERFFRWRRAAGLAKSEFNEALVSTYPCRPGKSERVTLCQFLKHLRKAGVAPPCGCPAPSSTDQIVERYVDYLRHGRGLADRSVAVYAPFVREFAVARDLKTVLDARAVRRHILDRSQGRSCEHTRLLATSLRSFLRFLFLQGETETDLSVAVPPVQRWRGAAVPSFLSPDEVKRVLDTVDRTTEKGRRDLAMLLLLARLGFRAGEVAALELEDIRWASGEIVVRGKGQLHDRLPLPVEIGEALALYIRHTRGRSSSRRVFLRLRAPRLGFSGYGAVSAVARKAVRRAGIQPRGRAGAHLFRHSLATRMIRQGASLSEISQVLRHRCAETTQIYAKVDLETLRGVARPWPVVAGDDR